MNSVFEMGGFGVDIYTKEIKHKLVTPTFLKSLYGSPQPPYIFPIPSMSNANALESLSLSSLSLSTIRFPYLPQVSLSTLGQCQARFACSVEAFSVLEVFNEPSSWETLARQRRRCHETPASPRMHTAKVKNKPDTPSSNGFNFFSV